MSSSPVQVPRGRFLLVLLFGCLLLSTPVWAQSLPAPENFSVSMDGTVYRGRWEAVEGASYYEVWTKQYGNWRFSEKDENASPFTSSFEIPGADDRMQFRVRAVSAGGAKGEFSEELRATAVETPVPGKTTPVASSKGASADGFDPEAPAPPAPSSLFAVWSDPREIRLVWQASEKATRYTIEELADGKWVSVTNVEFPKPTTAILKNKPMPGPFQFRVKAIGRNGRASEPSRPTTAKR